MGSPKHGCSQWLASGSGRIRGLVLLVATLSATAAWADNLDLYGSFRVRLEMVDGQPRFPFRSSDAIVALRTLVGARYTTGQLTLGAELQDSRIYGDVPDSAVTNGDVNAVEAIGLNATLALPDALGEGQDMTVTVGRMRLVLGPGRLVSAPDFRNATNGFTGVNVVAQLPGKTTAHLFWALPEFRQPFTEEGVLANAVQWDNVSLGRQIWALDLARGTNNPRLSYALAYVGFREMDSPAPLARARFLHTFGPRLMLAPAAGEFDTEIEGLVQTGHVRPLDAPDAPGTPVLAWTLHAAVGYTFDHSWHPRLALRYDQASGETPGDRFTRFDRLYGTRGPDFGPSGIYSAIGRQNIVTPSVQLAVAPGSRWTAEVNGRALWADSATDAFSTTNVIDRSGESGRWAGWEVDGRSQFWLVPDRLRWDFAGAWLQKKGLLLTAPNATPGKRSLYLASSLTSFF